MLERAALLKEQQLAFIKTNAPTTIKCRRHPEHDRQLDEEFSAEATAAMGTLTARYLPCPNCKAEVESSRLVEYGLPANLTHANFDNFTPGNEDEAGFVKVVESFYAARRGFLILLGGYGTGKSHLAAAAFRRYGQGWFVSHNSLLVSLRHTYRDKMAFDPIERGKNARLLVLDDVGLSGGGRDELPMLHEILNHRHCDKLPTVITSNLSYECLIGLLGERMADRLRESTFRVLTFTGASHRKKARELYFTKP